MKYSCLFVLFFLASGWLTAQNTHADYSTLRETLFIQGQSISHSDESFSSLNGEVLPALVRLTTSQYKTFIFETFRNINTNNQEHVLERIKNSIPELMGISCNGKTITASFRQDITEEQLNDFFKLFGFSGYKIMIEE